MSASRRRSIAATLVGRRHSSHLSTNIATRLAVAMAMGELASLRVAGAQQGRLRARPSAARGGAGVGMLRRYVLRTAAPGRAAVQVLLLHVQLVHVWRRLKRFLVVDSHGCEAQHMTSSATLFAVCSSHG